MQIFKAELETRNFSFAAYGDSHVAAHRALTEGLKRHAAQYRIPEDWFKDLEDEIASTPVELGVCYRDREVLR